MIRVGVGEKCLMIDRINDEPKEYIFLRNEKEIEELFRGLANLIMMNPGTSEWVRKWIELNGPEKNL